MMGEGPTLGASFSFSYAPVRQGFRAPLCKLRLKSVLVFVFLKPYFSSSSSSPQAPVQRWSGTEWSQLDLDPCLFLSDHVRDLHPFSRALVHCPPLIWQKSLVKRQGKPIDMYRICFSIINSLFLHFPANYVGRECFLQKQNTNHNRFSLNIYSAFLSRLLPFLHLPKSGL